MTQRLLQALMREDSQPADPANALLDLAEGMIRLLVEQGHGAPLRARLRRLLPDTASLADPTALELAEVLAACRAVESRRMSTEQHEAMRRLKRWLVDRLPVSKRGRTL